MSEAAVHYFAEWSMGISAELISSWEAEITIAESLRDQDKKAMDILKAQTIGLQARHGGNLADTRLEAGGWMPGTDTFWMQLALDIEEQQIGLQYHVYQMSLQAWEDEQQKVEADRELLRVQLNVLTASQAKHGYSSNSQRTTLLEVDEIPGAFDEETSDHNGTLPYLVANLLARPDPLLELDSAAPEDFEISLPSTIASDCSEMSSIKRQLHLLQIKRHIQAL
ncbi:hypothetical protein C0989_009462 [Termitomyces sp. Mn162]|nr:hypothetical protein C0989_009462 [Termitomyces sp. Mn162]